MEEKWGKRYLLRGGCHGESSNGFGARNKKEVQKREETAKTFPKEAWRNQPSQRE